MQGLEVVVSVIERTLLTLLGGEQPEELVILINPRCASPPSVTHSEHEGIIDRQNPFLSSRSKLRQTPTFLD